MLVGGSGGLNNGYSNASTIIKENDVKIKRKLYPDLLNAEGKKVKKPTTPFLLYY
jgi:hypothetical protein